MERHRELRQVLLSDILHGRLGEGGRLATEQQLTREHGVSRVTVRRAMDDLKRQGVLTATPGRGTQLAQRRGGFEAPLDLIAVVAPFHNPFFAGFVRELDDAASRRGALVLFKQDFAGTMLADPRMYLSLLDCGIRHVVLWPHQVTLDVSLLARLRSIGVNLTIFDQPVCSDAADIVALDSRHAMRNLVSAMRQRIGDGPLALLCHDDGLATERDRHAAFVAEAGGDAQVVVLQRAGEEATHKQVRSALRRLARCTRPPRGVVCTHGGLGIAAARLAGASGPLVGTIDLLPEMRGLRLLAIDQPIAAMARAVLNSLIRQSTKPESWRPMQRLLQGDLIDVEVMP